MSAVWDLIAMGLWAIRSLLFALGAFVAITQVLAVVRYTKNKRLLAHIAGIEQFLWIQHPLFLVWPSVARYNRNDIFKQLPGLFRAHDTPILKFASGTQRCVFINDSELVRTVAISMRKQVEKPMEMYNFIKLYGPNLIASTGEVWKAHRTAGNFAFNDANLKLVAQKAASSLRDMFAKWAALPSAGDGGARQLPDVHADMTALTLAVISMAGFGKEVDVFGVGGFLGQPPAQGDRRMAFMDAMHIVVNNFIVRFFVPAPLLQHSPFPKLRQVHKGFEDFKSHLRDVVAERKLFMLNEKQARFSDQPTGAETQRADLLHLLLLSQDTDHNHGGPVLSDNEVMDECFIFLFAGHETTASTLSWALLRLAQHPAIQDKLREEADAVFGDRNPTFDDLPELHMARAVFKETQRLHPVIVAVPKEAETDITLGGVLVPAKTPIFVHIYSVHRNPKHWPDPEAFRPERFDDRVSPPPAHGTFIPFSIGPRKCLGFRFAEVEGVIALAMICQQYTISLAPDADVERLFETQVGMAVMPKHRLDLLVTRRRTN